MHFGGHLTRGLVLVLLLAAGARLHFAEMWVRDEPCKCAHCLYLDTLTNKIGDAVGYAETVGEEAERLLEEFERKERKPAEVYLRTMEFMECFGETQLSSIRDKFDAIFGEVMREACRRLLECKTMLAAVQEGAAVKGKETHMILASFEHALCAAERKIVFELAAKIQRILFLLRAKGGDAVVGHLQMVRSLEMPKSVGDRT
jgi:hypothetical protein